MQSNHMERMHMWSSFKIWIEDLRLSSNVAVTVTKNRKLLSKKIFKIWGMGSSTIILKNITYVSNLIAIYSKGFFWIF
jgi:hypothetical protein